MSDRQLAAFDPTDERAVIGTILRDPDHAFPLVAGELRPGLFFDPVAQAAFWAMGCDLAEGIKPNNLTIARRLSEADRLEEVGGNFSIAELVNPLNCTSLSNLPFEVERLRDKAVRRWAMQVSIEGETIEEVLADLEHKAAKVRELQGESQRTALALGSLVRPDTDDGKNLLGNRWLCRGGGGLWVGPTGIGKSVITMQAAVAFSRRQPIFGIRPAGYLKSLIIQAENDDGDMAEMRDGVFHGLGLSEQDRKLAGELVLCYQENGSSGHEFFTRTVEPLLREHTPDLLWLDPALAYIGGESNSQADVGRFLRNWLNPLLTKYGCGGIVVHHTNKPPTGKEKTDWTGSDLAYLGSGSAEWANWARCVLGIRSLGDNDVFELCLGKRGARAGMCNEEGQTVYSALIAHSKEPGRIYWRLADESERPGSESDEAHRKFNVSHVAEFIPEDGIKTCALHRLVCTETGMSKAQFYRLLKEGEASGKLFKDKTAQLWEVSLVSNQSNRPR